MDAILQNVIDNFIFLLFFEILFLGSIIRQGKKAEYKKLAFILIIFLSLLFWVALFVIKSNGWNSYYAFVPLGFVLIVGFIFRKWVWPFKTKCVKCGKKLTITQILSIDENKCEECFLEDHPEQREVKAGTTKRDSFWDTWEYDYLFSTVIIMNQKKEILLIERKNKLKGSGRISGATAFCKEDENTLDACLRAAEEETGLKISNPVHMGYLNMALSVGNLRGHVYLATQYEGEIKETENNKPYWQKTKGMPFKQMSVDYKVWLPHLVKGTHFDYYIIGNKQGQVAKDSLYIDSDEEYLNF